MTRVLVLAAIDVEARMLARELGLSPVAESAWPHFRDDDVELTAIGVRGAALTARIGACRAPDLVVAAGACGALSPELAEGELVVPVTVLAPDGESLVTTVLADLPRNGTLLTVTAVVESADTKARLWLETGARAVDMESSIVLGWARSRGVPAGVVRAVSDVASRAVPADLAAVVGPDGRVSRHRAVRAMLARPRAVSDAIALRRGTTAALHTVAAALERIAR